MARKPTATTGTDIANYDEELARLAAATTTLTSDGGGGRFFSTRAGVLQYDDTPMPGNQMCVIIAAWCLENLYYEESFDADNRTPPTCFAFCKDPGEKDEMAPHPSMEEHPDTFTAQNDTCKGCPQNEFGSAAKGRGKACANRRRLACIPAGTYKSAGRHGGFELELINDPDHFRTAEAAFLKIPVMSGKGFDAYVRDVAEQLRKPLFAVYTRVYLTPDPKSQFKVNFELIEPVERELIPTLLGRYKTEYETIDFPYRPFVADEEEAVKTTASNTKLKGRASAPAKAPPRRQGRNK